MDAPVAVAAIADTAPAKARFADALAVYLRRRVLIVMFLGFSGGLPLALSGATLLYWMADVGVNLRTIGLFALVGTPYTFKFLWAPLVDALNVPWLSRRFGRRRGWLLLTQLLLMAAIVFLGLRDPLANPWLVALGGLLVAIASATQDIVIDAFRVDGLDDSEQATGINAYVIAYRVGMVASNAGTLFLVSGFEALGYRTQGAWSAGYVVTAALVLVGIVTTLVSVEPEKSAAAEEMHRGKNAFRRLWITVIGAFGDFFLREGVLVALIVLAFVVLFKFTDALAGVMTGPFSIEIGFSRNEYAAIVKGVGLAAAIAGGFAGGFVARAYPLAISLWIGGLIQAVANFAFSWQAVVGHDAVWLAFAITAENFTSGVGTVIFVTYLTALCRNPLHTAMQYALLTALASFGRTVLAAPGGRLAESTGWVWFFAICAIAALPSFVLLAWLQRRGHFAKLAVEPK
ncbi:MAG TPA: MFS transporter [Xanthobacteraceae bacterium]|jgi:PAT family beta-lactamase induction signal transducer AmpG|nr:MFS transporter [Xanthobacteraceae bacterium]